MKKENTSSLYCFYNLQVKKNSVQFSERNYTHRQLTVLKLHAWLPSFKLKERIRIEQAYLDQLRWLRLLSVKSDYMQTLSLGSLSYKNKLDFKSRWRLCIHRRDIFRYLTIKIYNWLYFIWTFDHFLECIDEHFAGDLFFLQIKINLVI